jgi:hypothetical protein
VTVGMVVLAAPAAGVPLSSASGRPTALHTYTAFEDGKLAPGLIVRASVRGSCWAQSEVESHLVACPDEPWSNHVLLLRLTKPLPHWHAYRRAIPPSAWPWAIITIAGKHCVTTVAAATGEIRGKPITYVCQGGGLLLGFTRRATATWTIWYAPTFTGRRLRLVTIADAWLH